MNAVLTYHSRDAGILALALAPTMCRESPAAGKGFIQPTRRSLLPRLRVTGTSIETCTCAWACSPQLPLVWHTVDLALLQIRLSRF